ncbi:Na/Pi symporter [Ktedonobacter sp. SOSP1-52]|uniref:Na/Pi symporter n=1 Tax=Ktedonobacter sp. SOSP1-52 TaxID=2778366 RepID=UPI001F2E1834|nr:Na/Pi symporter [Ktedonobacter sp. SOSP1-52]
MASTRSPKWLSICRGGHVRRLFLHAARFPVIAYLVSLIMTACLQSSSVVSSLLIELVSTDLMPFSTAIMMLLGANVGSTLAVQLLSFHVTDYALTLVGLFALLALMTARTRWRWVGQIAFPCGLMLLGLFTLSQASELLANSAWAGEILQIGASSPLLLLLLGAALAMMLNSSTATIGLVLVLASRHTLPLVPALAAMLGANIGTTLPALIAAASRNAALGQRLALVHTGTKCLGACLLFLLLHPLAALLTVCWPSPLTQPAMAHLGLNVLLTCLWVPLAGPLTWLLTSLEPSGEKASVCQISESARYPFSSPVSDG